MRFLGSILLTLLLAFVALFSWLHANARADPIVRTARIGMRDWPKGAKPVRLLLASDIHIGNEAMDAARLTRIVAQMQAQSSDVILLAGDFVAGHEKQSAFDAAAAMITPLSGLHAPLGVFAVLGNHDYSTVPKTIATDLRRAGIRVLENDAVRVGPLALAGIGDLFTGHHDEARTLADVARIGGLPVAVTHGDDRDYLHGKIQLMLVGHTHCEQISLSRWGIKNPNMDIRHGCGIVRDKDGVTITTAGLGTSVLPLRFNAPPDLWVITLGPAVR